MEEINLESHNDLTLHDFFNYWILEPIVDSKYTQTFVELEPMPLQKSHTSSVMAILLFVLELIYLKTLCSLFF